MLKKSNNSYYILIIIGLCIAIYSNSFYCEFQLDDKVHIATDNQIRNLNFYTNIDSWKNVNDRPLAFYTLALNKSIHGLDVVGYHIFNLTVHIISSIFVFLFSLLILQQLRIKRLTKNKGWIALFTALLFATHPIQTQAVTYIIQRMTSMSAMFYIGSAYFYIRGRSSHVADKLGWNALVFYCLTIVFTIASLLSKQTAVSLPFALLAIEIFFIKDIEGNKFRKYIYTFSITLTLLTSIVIIAGYLPKETDTISRLDYFITQLRVIPKYFQLLLFPIAQNLDYDFSVSSSLWGLKEISGLLFLAGLIYLIKRLFKNHKLISFGIVWILITLSVESSIIPIRDVIFEHRLYLPMVGFSLLIVYLIFAYAEKKTAIWLLSIIILLLSIKTFTRNKDWKTTLTLWTDVVEKSPNKARPHLILGSYYFNHSNPQRALSHFNKAIKIEPGNWQGYFNRGEVNLFLNKTTEAISDYSESIKYKNDFPATYDSRGTAKLWLKDYQSAINDFTIAISLDHNFESAYFNRANAYIYIKDYKNAMRDFNQSILINPAFAEAYNNRGKLNVNLKNYKEAIKDLDKAIHISPKLANAYNIRARAYYELGEYKMALSDLKRANQLGVKINPRLVNLIKSKLADKNE